MALYGGVRNSRVSIREGVSYSSSPAQQLYEDNLVGADADVDLKSAEIESELGVSVDIECLESDVG